ncbi:BgTH12-04053 [Blumeria graminis f. sp. triticale]|uniref:Bgt-51015 n=2 Tax=Blumeria graminis TaxID=34373 RepID=A0A9X9L9A7_BLUGR|nr:BgTH12-04053 [Blumeria graminis f. sp. triticale]VCU40123.1 Bgt-51015 [Blumeria graminis f. sp. tritici]
MDCGRSSIYSIHTTSALWSPFPL